MVMASGRAAWLLCAFPRSFNRAHHSLPTFENPQFRRPIRERADGLATACTRQNAGKPLYAALPPPSGDVNPPAATVFAEVMLVSFSLRDTRLSQSASIAR